MTWSAWLLASSILLSPGEVPGIEVISEWPNPDPTAAAREAACFAMKEGEVTLPVRVALRFWQRVGHTDRYLPRTYFLDIISHCDEKRPRIGL